MSWEQLKAIIEEAKEMAEDQRRQPPLACPVCGTPLDVRNGIYSCPMGHYRTTGARREQ